MTQAPTRTRGVGGSACRPGATAESRRAAYTASLAAAAGTLLLAGCGTVVQLDGEVCGAPVKLVLTDHKDREEFGGRVLVTSADGSTCEVSLGSTGSGPSAVPAEAVGRMLGALIEAGALP